jgi:hypothetical protein
MAATLPTHDLAVAVLGALGLPTERVMSFSLRFEPQQVVTADLRIYLTRESIGEMVAVLRRYAITAQAPGDFKVPDIDVTTMTTRHFTEAEIARPT